MKNDDVYIDAWRARIWSHRRSSFQISTFIFSLKKNRRIPDWFSIVKRKKAKTMLRKGQEEEEEEEEEEKND